MSRHTPALLSAALIAALAAPAWALDYGVDVSDETTLTGEGSAVTLSQENEVAAWISMPIGSFSSLYARALYSFEGDFRLAPSSQSDVVPYTFNAGRVEWEGFLPIGESSSLSWSLGRIRFSDHSGKAFAGLFDGASVAYSIGSIRIEAQAAYTGLSLKDDAGILMDADDEAIWAADSTWTDLYAPARLVASLRVLAVELAPRHDLGLEGWAQFDLESGTATNTQYLEPYVEGRLGRSWRWRLWGLAEFGQDADGAFYSLGAGGSARFALPETLGFRAGLSASWASGDYDGAGSMRAFAPITASSMAAVSSFGFSDVLAVSADASLSPLSGLVASLNATAMFRPGEAGAGAYRGSEASLRLRYAPWTDFSASLIGGYFLANAAAAVPDDSAWTIGLTAGLEL